MKTHTSLTLLAAGLLAIAVPVQAQGYIGLGLGQSRAHLDCGGASTCDKTGNASKIYGGYMFGPQYGAELAYYNQGKAKVTGTDPMLGDLTGRFKGQGYGAYGVVAMPLADGALFAKLGVVSAKVTLDATSSVAGSASESERHTNVAWALGGDYNFSKALAGRLEFERVRAKFMSETTDIDLVTLGLLMRF